MILYILLEFISFGYFWIPKVNEDLNEKCDSGRCLFEEMSIRGNVCSGNCHSGNCPSEKCLSGELSVQDCPPSWSCPKTIFSRKNPYKSPSFDVTYFLFNWAHLTSSRNVSCFIKKPWKPFYAVKVLKILGVFLVFPNLNTRKYHWIISILLPKFLF